MTIEETPTTSTGPAPLLTWRDLACLPWFIWLAGAISGFADRIPRQAGDTSSVMPTLLLGLAAFPAFLLIWSKRRAWLIRRGWWIPLLAMLAGGITVVIMGW